jgi:hypothetical protein
MWGIGKRTTWGTGLQTGVLAAGGFDRH